MSSAQKTGTRDVTYDLVSVIYHSLQGAETYEVYARDAEQNGDQDAAQCFRDAQNQSRQAADRAKKLLGQRLNQS